MMITVHNVNKTIEHNHVLQNITFNVNTGECLGIIGPNGSGKSTLLRLLTGIELLDSGTIAIDGKSIQQIPREELSKYMAVLPQEPLPSIPYRVEDVVMMGRYPHRKRFYTHTEEDYRVVDRIIEETGLENRRHRLLHQLSGGERQRVAIARTLAQQPTILLLDEPTTFLDIGYQIEILQLLKKWQMEHHLTMIVVLHDLNLAAQYCDRLLLLSNGRLVSEGTPEKVITSSQVDQVYGTTPIVIPHPISKVPQLLLQWQNGGNENE